MQIKGCLVICFSSSLKTEVLQAIFYSMILFFKFILIILHVIIIIYIIHYSVYMYNLLYMHIFLLICENSLHLWIFEICRNFLLWWCIINFLLVIYIFFKTMHILQWCQQNYRIGSPRLHSPHRHWLNNNIQSKKPLWDLQKPVKKSQYPR